MKTTPFVTAMALALVFSATCRAGGSDYGSAAASYQAEMKREDKKTVNTDFISDRVISQSKRITREVGEDADSAAAAAVAQANAEAAAARSRGGRASSVNIASPQIYGTVRGNVYVITQRSRGRVSSVSP
ncbi:MAG: hypothetical protein ABI605_01170 [Rhizobacter sp.]